MPRKIVIVGGVAGGATCAARLRRLGEDDEIVLLERGEYISFANCGLPYYVGDVITDKERLLVTSAERFRERFNVDVRLRHEVTRVDRAAKKVIVRDAVSGKESEESYDILVLSPGAQPVRPPLAGVDDDRVFTLRTVPDAVRLKRFLKERGVRSAVVVGGGFIGLEMAENLKEQGIGVTVVEKMTQVMPNLDPEIANIITQHMKLKKVNFVLGTGIAGFDRHDGAFAARLEDGRTIACDCAILAIGVRPDTRFLAEAGLDREKNGAVKVDRRMRTNDEHIYALGDAVVVDNPITDTTWGVALAWPANRQARVVADAIHGIDEAYPGTIGTSVVKIFDLTVASTGCSEKYLAQQNVAFQKSYTHAPQHVGYYPGAVPISMKLVFAPDTGRILGAQMVGTAGVDKRIDVIAAAIRMKATIFDLKNFECAYAPPYGAAKDPVNVAAFAAENIITGKIDVTHWSEIDGFTARADHYLLDVRTTEEYELGTIGDATNVPIDELRGRLNEVPKDKAIVAFCQVGLRGYVATRMLKQHGCDVSNLSGGYKTYVQATDTTSQHFVHDFDAVESDEREVSRSSHCGDGAVELDATGLLCPGPIRTTYEKIAQLADGEVLRVRATDPAFANDVKAWCATTGNDLISVDSADGEIVACIMKRAPRKAAAAAGGDEKTIVVFSGDFDRVMAAFIIATGAASMGRPVNMFFTFWGLNVLRKHGGSSVKKDALSRMFGAMMPRGARRLKISKLNMGGMGTSLMKHIMKKKKVDTVPELLAQAQKMGIKIIACQMTMEVMGLAPEELIDDIEFGGVANFLADADRSNTTLFI